MNDLTGQQIDQYRIEALLGEGGMGAVYRARDVHLNRLVALKIMKQSLARQPEFQQRFLQEAQAAARLKHPSIVQIYHFGNRQSLLYMAMAFVPGATLGAYVRRLQESRQILHLSESLFLLAQVADALGYAHRQGVVHRDIKPDNVLLESLDQPEREGEPPVRAVVTDFGLAKLLEGGVETQTGTFLGTMPYMSPEQCRGRNIDGRSDIYSLGILLYQLATGRLPFEIRTPAEAAEKHIRELPPLPHAIRPGLPADLEALILKAIAKQPEERFQTAEEMARALRQQARSDVTVLEAQAVEDKPTSPGTATVVSLVTQLMPEMTQGIAPSVSPGLAAPAGTDYLIIQRQGEADMTVSLDKTKLTIGRNQGNDIVLDAAGVSRQHARLERTTGGWQIMDTGSSNGTFVKSSQLLPNIPEPLEPGQVVRLGPFFLRWQAAAGTASAGGVAGQPQWSRTVRAGQTGVTQLLSMDGQLGILVNPTNVDVTPGGRAEIQIELMNHGVLVDHFELRLSKLPKEWVTLPPEPVQLMPAGSVSLPFTIHPPRHSSARAGLHPYQLDIFSASTRQRVATINGNVTVAPFARYKVEAQPTQLVNHGVCRVTVQNEGNSPATYAVQGWEPANALHFFGEQSALTVQPGQAGEVMLRVQPKARPLMGRGRPYSFQVQVQAGADEMERRQGIIDVRPRIPTWATWLVPTLTIFTCLGLALGGRAYLAGIRQTTTAVATQTAIAQTTLTAADDPDGDGLSNAQETQVGTNPNQADSDNDGLDDGAETNIHFTNPMNPDSDNDGLRDGDEIGLGTFANVPDSDGDGQLDGIDPDPLATATPTPNAGATQAVVDAQNANATATTLAQAAENAATSTALALVQQTVSAQQTQQAIFAQQTVDAQNAAAQTAVAQTAEAQQTLAAATQTAQSATATAQARLVAHYPLTDNATDLTGKQANMTLTNAPFQNEGVYCNGIYPGSSDPNACVISTPNLNDFSFNSFSIQIEFNADEFLRMPVVVGGRSFRWIGFELNADGSISLLTNNNNREACTGAYQPGEWHTALLTYDGSVGKLYLDRILRCTVAFNLEHGNDRDVSVVNYSNGTIFKGHVRELRIFNEPIEPVLIISPPIAVTLLPPIISP